MFINPRTAEGGEQGEVPKTAPHVKKEKPDLNDFDQNR